jgi:hypothetical protein
MAQKGGCVANDDDDDDDEISDQKKEHVFNYKPITVAWRSNA